MNAPERFYNVSQSQLSIARHYGGITFNGAHYHYDAASDTLTRADVWAAQEASSKQQRSAAAQAERDKWTQAQTGFDGI